METLRLVSILIGTPCPEETRFRRGFSKVLHALKCGSFPVQLPGVRARIIADQL